MSNLVATLLMLSVNLPGWADAPTLKEARERWLRGNYAEASRSTKLARTANRVPAAIGWRCCKAREYDKRLITRPRNKGTGRPAGRRAELEYLRGNLVQARRMLSGEVLNAECFVSLGACRVWWDKDG